MLSEMFLKLWHAGLIQKGIWETIYMTVISTAISYVIGLPLGVILTVTDKGGIHPIPWLNRVLGVIVNFFRSIPFIILMVAMLPVAKFVVGTSLGNKAMIVMLVIAAAPYIARMVESSLLEVDRGVIEAAQSMGADLWTIIWKVMICEARTSLIVGATIALGTVLGYSAMAGAVGGGGLGDTAITYGYYRYQTDIMLVTVLLLILLVQIMQWIGTRLAKKLDRRLS